LYSSTNEPHYLKKQINKLKAKNKSKKIKKKEEQDWIPSNEAATLTFKLQLWKPFKRILTGKSLGFKK